MKKLFKILGVVVLVSVVSYVLFWRFNTGTPINETKLKNKAQEAYLFCKKEKYNTDFCILIDYSVHSGRNRFIVWDFKNSKVLKKGLVSHGCAKIEWGSDLTKCSPLFGNEAGSYRTSLGKYRIGKRGRSIWGIYIKYWLYGLESSNRNAMKRAIVLHSWKNISYKEVYPKGTPEGAGCPAVSDKMMVYLDNLLKSSKRPVLLWAYK